MKIKHHIRPIVAINKTERRWHFPVLAGFCIGLCLFVGWYFDNLKFGGLSSLGALSILYFTHQSLEKRMVHIAMCAFGIIFAFAFGNTMSFSHVSGVLALSFIAFISHLITSYFRIPPPGNFFFIMVASLAINIPFDVDKIPTNVGLVTMGAILSVLFAFLYSVFVSKNVVEIPIRRVLKKKRYTKLVESIIIGLSCGLGLSIGILLKMENPYWICIAVIAVLQGKNLTHTSHRNFQRIIGTFLGLGLTWVIVMLLEPNSIGIVIVLTVLQIIIESLIVRNYMLAAIFITPLTIILAEASSGVVADPATLMKSRLIDTVIGSLVGWLAGWFLHHESLINRLEKQIRSANIFFRTKSTGFSISKDRPGDADHRH